MTEQEAQKEDMPIRWAIPKFSEAKKTKEERQEYERTKMLIQGANYMPPPGRKKSPPWSEQTRKNHEQSVIDKAAARQEKSQRTHEARLKIFQAVADKANANAKEKYDLDFMAWFNSELKKGRIQFNGNQHSVLLRIAKGIKYERGIMRGIPDGFDDLKDFVNGTSPKAAENPPVIKKETLPKPKKDKDSDDDLEDDVDDDGEYDEDEEEDEHEDGDD